jgi:hypothetical protein
MDNLRPDLYGSSDRRSMPLRSGRSTPGSSDCADAPTQSPTHGPKSPERDPAFLGPPSSGSSRWSASSLAGYAARPASPERRGWDAPAPVIIADPGSNLSPRLRTVGADASVPEMLADPGPRRSPSPCASTSPRALPVYSPTPQTHHPFPPPILFEREDPQPAHGARDRDKSMARFLVVDVAIPEGESKWTARATTLLESVKVLPAQGNDLKLLVREMRNVLNCHATFTEEHTVNSRLWVEKEEWE